MFCGDRNTCRHPGYLPGFSACEKLPVLRHAGDVEHQDVPVKGAVHYAYSTPDGEYIAATSFAGKIITIIDINTLEPLFDVKFDAGVRPVAFEKVPAA